SALICPSLHHTLASSGEWGVQFQALEPTPEACVAIFASLTPRAASWRTGEVVPNGLKLLMADRRSRRSKLRQERSWISARQSSSSSMCEDQRPGQEVVQVLGQGP